KDAEKYTPEVENKSIKKGDPVPAAGDMIKNKADLPSGTSFEYVDADGNPVTPKSDTPGDQDVTIKVTYPDKSTETVTGKITVTDPDAGKKDAEKYTPEVENKSIKKGDPVPAAGDMIKNKADLPSGTSFEYVDADGNPVTPKSDTPGDQDVTIKVTYPDKSTETVTGKITVTDAAPTKPVVDPIKAGDDKVKVGEPLVGDTVVVTLPDGSEVVVTKDPTTGKWTTGTGTEVPVKDGKLEIPVDPAKTTEGGEVTVVT
ncbi:Rib/alpha-like domain-containing protein, partial [Trueperella sp. LYQ143]|uniref:Rib/alpha-like domain-containing protein n=1 Tax=Trueperella sp. LYQ143 TaxID=3391059 RepID=UPI003983658F